MKSINAKKIAAVTTGAVLLGASLVAAAPIMYGNTEIINAQGKPVVKVVVGANAAASDGVAAANIAAVIGSLAYKTQTVSAQLTGSPTCSVSGTGSGSCSVSDEKVTLEITTPGTATVSGGYGFKTYGYGFIDNQGSSEDDQVANGTGYEKVLDSDELTTAFADYSSTISSVSGSFTEEQELKLLSTTAANWDSDEESYSFELDTMTYFITFDHNTFDGIPLCVKESELTSGNCSDDNTIDRQRLKVKYLGEEWIVSDMTNGSVVKLAKEASPAQIVYAGQSLTAGAYTVKLADLTIPYGSTAASAVIQIYDANEQLVKEDTAASGATKEVTLPNGDKISLHIYKVAPGLTTSKWAEMAVFTQELELTSGSAVDEDENENWTVTLGWVTSGTYANKGVLKNITLSRTSFDEIFEGESVNIIESPAPYQFTFSGWTLTDAQRDNLVVDWERISSYHNTDSNTSTVSITSEERDFVCFQSDKKAFNSVDIVNASNLSQVISSAATTFGDDRYKFCYSPVNGTLLYDKPDFGYVNATNTSATLTSAQMFALTYAINDDSSYDEKIYVGGDLSAKNATIRIVEDLKDNTGMDGYFQFVADQPNGRFINNAADLSEDKVEVLTYSGSSAVQREAGFVSQKGSVLSSRSDDSITLKMAKKLGEFQFFVKPSSSSVEAGTSTQTLSEGQQVTVQDSTVKVTSISETVGACSVSGGSAACTASNEGMSAVLDVAGTPSSASFAVPYAFGASDRLVVLDSEAPSAESLILVGGQLVNTVTASTIAGTDVKIDTPGVKVVSAVSDQRIVVAGYTAADTQEAAAQFVSQLLAQVQ